MIDKYDLAFYARSHILNVFLPLLYTEGYYKHTHKDKVI